MRHAALFNGIGGFQLAAQWMGWENVMSCEIDDFCNKVTKYHFPNCIQHGDIKTTDFSIYRGRIDVLTGGFPCQPFSAAGKRKGTADDRHLWPEMLRAIGEIRPNWIVGENVRGLINWSRGMVFEQVQADLENEGYDTQAYVLPACAVNAPHRRDRIWFVACHPNSLNGSGLQRIDNESRHVCELEKSRSLANTNGVGCAVGGDPKERQQHDEGWQTRSEPEQSGSLQPSADPDEIGLPNMEQVGKLGGWRHGFNGIGNTWEKFPTQPAVCFGNDGIPPGLDLHAISKKDWREESIKAAGNAIVPQVAYEIFKAIEQYHKTYQHEIRLTTTP